MGTEKFQNLENRIKELKRRINEFISSGGDIYAPKRQLPYYDYMSNILDSLRKQDPTITYEDVYMLCGIKFDREYNHFKKFANELKKFSNGGNVDAIRTNKVREKNNVYEVLKNYADKYNTMPFDFLYLMTGFYFTDCYIRTDYIENLKQELLDAYPTRDITGIRWERPDLYEKIRIAERYLPKSSKQNIIESLGFHNTRLTSTNKNTSISQIKIKEELQKLYPDGIIIKLASLHPSLYHQLLRFCQNNDITLEKWAINNGFTYPIAQPHRKLAITKVDADERMALLSNLKAKHLESSKVVPSDEIDMFRLSLNTTLAVIDELNSADIQNSVNHLIQEKTEEK